jgi:cytochrome c oxidase subunit IV
MEQARLAYTPLLLPPLLLLLMILMMNIDLLVTMFT